MRTHVKIVALVNLVYSALGLLTAAGVLFGGVFTSLATFNPIAIIIGSVTSVVIAVILAVLSGIGLLAGFALLNHASWARRLIIAISVLRLFRWPVGTAFGVYSLWVLTHEETKRAFALRS